MTVSHTTRAPRPGERDGEHYHFVTPEAFERALAEGAFLETAMVHGARYGTPKDQVEQAIAAGDTIVLEIDVQGARAVRAAYPDALLVFVEPPSWEVLELRLSARATESPEALAVRLANARAEVAAAPEFDHRIVNADLDDAVSQLIGIIEGSSGPSAGSPPKE